MFLNKNEESGVIVVQMKLQDKFIISPQFPTPEIQQIVNL